MGQTVNLLAYAFGGSNPSLPTRKRRKRYDEKPSVLRVESPTGVEVDLSLEKKYCQCSSGVEHFLGKEEVVSSNLTNSSGESLQKQAFLKYSKWRYRLGVRT